MQGCKFDMTTDLAEKTEEIETMKLDLGNVGCVVCGNEVYEMYQGLPVHVSCYKGNEAELKKVRENAERGLMLV